MFWRSSSWPVSAVAPLAGSVDRNQAFMQQMRGQDPVAPLAGSVDRNAGMDKDVTEVVGSLPSRGAWIEMMS